MHFARDQRLEPNLKLNYENAIKMQCTFTNKNIIKMNLKHTLTYILIIACFAAHAQNKASIKFYDFDNGLPIVGAAYTYGNQSGISDENGTLYFTLSDEESMSINHIAYGTWTWNKTELKSVIENKDYYKRSLLTHLYPATVIAIKPNRTLEENIGMNYQERMEYDGAAILNKIPAINSIRKSGAYGFDPVFRGYKYGQLNIVLNGAQSATAACPNRMDPPTSQMAPNMMDRIEVLKGPYALRYGAGFGGTINFIPSKLRFTDKTDVYGRLSAGYESNGNIAKGEANVGVSGNKYDLGFFGAWSQGDDYKTGNGETVQSDFLRGSFGTNLGLKLNQNQQLRISGIYNMARDVDFAALPMDLREDDTWMVNATHNMQLDKTKLKSWSTNIFGSYVNHLMDNLLKPLNPRMLNAATPATTQNYGGRTEGTWMFKNNKLYGGADLRVEAAEGNRTREFLMGPMKGKTLVDNAWQKSKISKSSVFGEYHLANNGINYIISTRVELNNAQIEDPSPEFQQITTETEVSQINPSLSLGLKKGINNKINVGMWLGRVQRSGSLTERFINSFPVGQDPYELVGNPNIKPEINNQIDLTFEWKTKKTGFSVDYFASYLQDVITSTIDASLTPRMPSSPGVRRYTNLDKAVKTGFEVSWIQELPLNLQHQLGVAYTYAQDLENNDPLPEIAPFDLRYTLNGTYLDNKLLPEVVVTYAAKQSRISTQFGESETPSFVLLDAKLDYIITKKIKVNASLKNALNSNYYEHLTRAVKGSTNAIYAPGRSVCFGINISF